MVGIFQVEQSEVILPPQRPLMMSADSFSYHNVVWVDATDIYSVDARNITEHSITHRIAPHNGSRQPQMPIVLKLRNPGGGEKVCAVPPGWESPGAVSRECASE